jgi:hypothetical protein
MKRPRWKTVGITPERGDTLVTPWTRDEVDKNALACRHQRRCYGGASETRLQDVVLGRRAEFLSMRTLRSQRTSTADDEDAAEARRAG